MDEEEKRASPAEATSQPTRRLGEAMGNSNEEPDGAEIDKQAKPKKWSFGVLNDRFTDEVPGSVLLLSKQLADHNAPLGLQSVPQRASSSSITSPYPSSVRSLPVHTAPPAPKRTPDGAIILDPQPEDSMNDPLNWSSRRRDFALLSLGFYCMVGGGMTPILAAGFNDVAETYDVTVPRVALTTGLFMMGMGIGSVIASPTAILFGKRPVYLASCIMFFLTAIWCALSPSYNSLLVARIIQGIAVSPVEALPSATVAEIFFLHERAYRLGIYTLLLLGGKNLVPLISAIIIDGQGWRWVFWVIAIIVGLCFFLLFFFVPETFWNRLPRPTKLQQHPDIFHHGQHPHPHQVDAHHQQSHTENQEKLLPIPVTPSLPENGSSGGGNEITHLTASEQKGNKGTHVGFYNDEGPEAIETVNTIPNTQVGGAINRCQDPPTDVENFAGQARLSGLVINPSHSGAAHAPEAGRGEIYSAYYRSQPPKTLFQLLKPYSGRLSPDNWFKVAFRPFVLYAYPSVLWSAMVYSLSVGWLIVLSESVAHIYRERDSYNFTALQTGLVYLSPFIGGILGTAVAGKVSDLIVRYMSRKNDGVYEPEFRLVMGIPVALCTTIGLMGFGWSAEERNAWIVPTVFFGVISFGCTLGSTTAITFCVDSYRQYAGEALVTLNFSKNILHGLVFSLFFAHWLESEGSKDVFIAIGSIQMGCMLFTIPMFIYGKRARMWTVRKRLMEKY